VSPRSRRPRRRLSALVVNYNTGAFAEVAVASLRACWIDEGRHTDDLEIVVVDNASPIDQSASLERIEASGVRVIRSAENLGYSGGINLALSHTRGGPKDVVALLNPDLYFLPGSVENLVDYVAENADVGAADPRTYFDPGRVLHLPRNLLPTLREHVLTNFSMKSRAVLRAYTRRRARLAAEWWTATEPIDTDMLSGCCVFLRREVIDRLGGVLMDERFPLYFEDTDLFRRLRALDLRVVHQVRAEVLHHWSRSSGIGAAFEGEPRRRQRIAEREYFRKYYGPLGERFAAWLTRKGHEWGASAVSLHQCEDLGLVVDPPRISWRGERDFVIEVGLLDNWILSAGVVGRGDGWRCPPDAWDWWFEGAYFLRALDREDGSLLGAWSLVKATPGRTHPLPAPMPLREEVVR
jgi:GT2 family glycosyltransferase